jgi:acetyltransferase-like isoleucine patch superfamily enzyme
VTVKTFRIGCKDVQFGENCCIADFVNLYECTIGTSCFVGPFVEIQKNVSIGDRSKIQSHAFICELVSIGEDCFIGHGVCFTNDKFILGKPAGGDKSLWQRTVIGNNVCIGNNATILPVTICDDVVIGAGAVVTRDISLSGVYVGNPARRLEKSR